MDRRETIIDCWWCAGTGTIQQTGDDCEQCATSGQVKIIVVGPAVLSNRVVRR